MDEEPKKVSFAQRYGITWGASRSRSFFVSDRWLSDFGTQGPLPMVRDYEPEYEVTTWWGKALVVAAIFVILLAIFAF